MPTRILDVRGLSCPLPILRAKKNLSDLRAGETLQILLTDPSSLKDFEALCQTCGHSLESWTEENGIYTILLKIAD